MDSSGAPSFSTVPSRITEQQDLQGTTTVSPLVSLKSNSVNSAATATPFRTSHNRRPDHKDNSLPKQVEVATGQNDEGASVAVAGHLSRDNSMPGFPSASSTHNMIAHRMSLRSNASHRTNPINSQRRSDTSSLLASGIMAASDTTLNASLAPISSWSGNIVVEKNVLPVAVPATGDLRTSIIPSEQIVSDELIVLHPDFSLGADTTVMGGGNLHHAHTVGEHTITKDERPSPIAPASTAESQSQGVVEGNTLEIPLSHGTHSGVNIGPEPAKHQQQDAAPTSSSVSTRRRPSNQNALQSSKEVSTHQANGSAEGKQNIDLRVQLENGDQHALQNNAPLEGVVPPSSTRKHSHSDHSERHAKKDGKVSASSDRDQYNSNRRDRGGTTHHSVGEKASRTEYTKPSTQRDLAIATATTTTTDDNDSDRSGRSNGLGRELRRLERHQGKPSPVAGGGGGLVVTHFGAAMNIYGKIGGSGSTIGHHADVSERTHRKKKAGSTSRSDKYFSNELISDETQPIEQTKANRKGRSRRSHHVEEQPQKEELSYYTPRQPGGHPLLKANVNRQGGALSAMLSPPPENEEYLPNSASEGDEIADLSLSSARRSYLSSQSSQNNASSTERSYGRSDGDTSELSEREKVPQDEETEIQRGEHGTKTAENLMKRGDQRPFCMGRIATKDDDRASIISDERTKIDTDAFIWNQLEELSSSAGEGGGGNTRHNKAKSKNQRTLGSYAQNVSSPAAEQHNNLIEDEGPPTVSPSLDLRSVATLPKQTTAATFASPIFYNAKPNGGSPIDKDINKSDGIFEELSENSMILGASARTNLTNETQGGAGTGTEKSKKSSTSKSSNKSETLTTKTLKAHTRTTARDKKNAIKSFVREVERDISDNKEIIIDYADDVGGHDPADPVTIADDALIELKETSIGLELNFDFESRDSPTPSPSMAAGEAVAHHHQQPGLYSTTESHENDLKKRPNSAPEIVFFTIRFILAMSSLVLQCVGIALPLYTTDDDGIFQTVYESGSTSVKLMKGNILSMWGEKAWVSVTEFETASYIRLYTVGELPCTTLRKRVTMVVAIAFVSLTLCSMTLLALVSQRRGTTHWRFWQRIEVLASFSSTAFMSAQWALVIAYYISAPFAWCERKEDNFKNRNMGLGIGAITIITAWVAQLLCFIIVAIVSCLCCKRRKGFARSESIRRDGGESAVSGYTNVSVDSRQPLKLYEQTNRMPRRAPSGENMLPPLTPPPEGEDGVSTQAAPRIGLRRLGRDDSSLQTASSLAVNSIMSHVATVAAEPEQLDSPLSPPISGPATPHSSASTAAPQNAIPSNDLSIL